MYVTPIYPLSAPLTAGATISTDNSSFRRYGTLYNANVEYTLNYNGSRTPLRVHNTEGYADTSGNLHYYRKDHLGNIREVWMLTQGVRQSTRYYASGLPCYDADNDSYLQPYKFGGKEFIETHRYDSYDFHARMRMGAVPVFETPDPLVEIRPWLSPYVFCSNNLVNRTDPTGLIDLPEVLVTAPYIHTGTDNSDVNLFDFVMLQMLSEAERKREQLWDTTKLLCEI